MASFVVDQSAVVSRERHGAVHALVSTFDVDERALEVGDGGLAHVWENWSEWQPVESEPEPHCDRELGPERELGSPDARTLTDELEYARYAAWGIANRQAACEDASDIAALVPAHLAALCDTLVSHYATVLARPLSREPERERTLMCNGPLAPALGKYWSQRYRLFSRFDEGIRLDAESWWSVTPERIARHIAVRVVAAAARAAAPGQVPVVLDGFCGAGGNSIQFALAGARVIAIDIDEAKLALLAHNAGVYGVDTAIERHCGDFTALASSFVGRAHVVFLSPPWGGPDYSAVAHFRLAAMGPLDGVQLFRTAAVVAPAVACFLPRNCPASEIVPLASWLAARTGRQVLCDMEENSLSGRIKAVTAYISPLDPHDES